MRVTENILLSSLTTMRLGGPARFVLEVENANEVADAYNFAESYRLPTFAMGYGANSLGHDEGFPGVIIINRLRGIAEEQTNNGVRLTIMGGEYWDDVVAYACERGLTGIEALSKIPGLVAAAPVQNIGAYGQEIADTLVSIDVYDAKNRTFLTLPHDALGFGYRKSILNTTERGRYYVLSVTLELGFGSMPRPFYRSVEEYIEENDCEDFSPKGVREIVSTIRADKLPDPTQQASSGSFFKNIYLSDVEAEHAEEKGQPVIRGKDGNKINAGWLIEQAGFKGELLHGIRVSDKAALVLINESAQSFSDLAKARDEISGRIYDMFGYWLEQEPVEIGG